ncbi:MAG: PstS family phosphate ABC transporter substrate-binding protein [Gammaproteobacteria bacterium]|nr:PstS family phosphate ABC transporter substrate-binding protein [Gammaproteobacteria bacterium]
MATPTPTMDPAPRATSMMPPPVATPTPTPVVTPQTDDESPALLRTATEVRSRIILAVVEDGCTFVRTEGRYSAFRTLPHGRISGDPSGEVRTVAIERTTSGNVEVVASSISSAIGSGAIEREFHSPLDFDAYLDSQVGGMTDMLRGGEYTGPASFLGRPALRYEVRMERPGGVDDGSAETLLVWYFDKVNPFIRGEEQYLLLPGGIEHLERQWYVSEFQAELCGTDDGGGEAEAVTREIRTRVAATKEEFLARVESGCALALSTEGLREAEQATRTELLAGESAVGMLKLRASIAGVGEHIEEAESRHFPEGVVNARFYGGETELYGQPAVGYLRRDLRAVPEGLRDVLTVGEYVRASPLLFRVKTYTLTHDGETQPLRTYTVPAIQSVVCPTPTPSGEVQSVQSPRRQPIIADGSGVVFHVTHAAAEEFRKEQPDIDIRLFVSGTGGGFKGFTTGEVDISNASRPIRDSEAEIAVANGIEYIEMRIGTEGLVVVAHPENGFVDCLTVAELNTIWARDSTINSWKDVRQGFPDLDVRLYGPDSYSGTYDYFMEEINGIQSSRSDYIASNDVSVLVQGIVDNQGSLGFFGYDFYLENEDTLKAIAIDAGEGCVVPDPASIEDGSYKPLARPLFIYVNVASLERPAVRAFVEHYMDHAYDLVVGEGYLPVPPSVYTANKAAAGL